MGIPYQLANSPQRLVSPSSTFTSYFSNLFLQYLRFLSPLRNIISSPLPLAEHSLSALDSTHHQKPRLAQAGRRVPSSSEPPSVLEYPGKTGNLPFSLLRFKSTYYTVKPYLILKPFLPPVLF